MKNKTAVTVGTGAFLIATAAFCAQLFVKDERKKDILKQTMHGFTLIAVGFLAVPAIQQIEA